MPGRRPGTAAVDLAANDEAAATFLFESFEIMLSLDKRH